MGRILVKTDKEGVFKLASEPEGKNVKAKADDRVFDNLIDAQAALSDLPQATGNGNSETHAAEKAKPPKEKAPKAEPERTKLSSGAEVVGKTTTIKCQWRGPDGKGKVCGKERTIKVQDAFQVKFCLEHRDEAAKLKRNEMAKARRQRKAAEKAAAAK